MKTPFGRSKSAALPTRPTFPIEARLAELRKEQRELRDQMLNGEISAAEDDDAPTVEQEAYSLLSLEFKPKPSPKSLRHREAVVAKAIEIGTRQLDDLRAAWAAGELSSRLGDFRDIVKRQALAIALTRSLERERQDFIQKFGAAGALTLPTGRIGLGVALNASRLAELMSAAVAAGIVTRKEIEDV